MSLTEDLPKLPEKPRLEADPDVTTRTDAYDNEAIVKPLLAAVYEQAQMRRGYVEFAEFDLEWAEQDLPAMYEVLPPT